MTPKKDNLKERLCDEFDEITIRRYLGVVPFHGGVRVEVDIKGFRKRLSKAIQEARNQERNRIREGVEKKKVDTGIKMYPNKRTGEMRYLYGRSPSSVCIGCGQKYKAEKQGFNQALTEILKIIDVEGELNNHQI